MLNTNRKYYEIATVKFVLSIFFLVALFSGNILAQPSISFNLPKEIVLGEIYQVSIDFAKNQYSGKLSLRQIFPPGVIINEQTSQGAIFSFSENELKLQWLEIPENDNFTVEYALFVPENFKEQKDVISSFTYLQNNQIVHRDLPVILLPIISEEADSQQSKASKKEEIELPDNAESVIKQPIFKIQVGAFSTPIPTDVLAKRLGIEGYEISYFKHKGLHKYTIGSFNTKQEALQFKQDKLNKLSDSFIVVFVEGQRVDLEDAIELIKEETE